LPNPNYKGMRKPLLSKIIYTYMDPSTFFAAFQNDEIYQVGYESLTPADFELVRSFGAALLEGAALEAAVRGVVEQGEGRGECGVAAGD